VKRKIPRKRKKLRIWSGRL